MSQCCYWKGWLHCLSSGFADLALWTIAKHKASSPWPWPTHLLGVGDDLFVLQLSWKKLVSLWEGGKRERHRVASPEERSGLLGSGVQLEQCSVSHCHLKVVLLGSCVELEQHCLLGSVNSSPPRSQRSCTQWQSPPSSLLGLWGCSCLA